MKYDAFYIKAKCGETSFRNILVLVAIDDVNNRAIEVYCDYSYSSARFLYCGRILIDDEQVIERGDLKTSLMSIQPYIGRLSGYADNIKIVTATPIKKEMYDFLTAPQNTIIQN